VYRAAEISQTEISVLTVASKKCTIKATDFRCT